MTNRVERNIFILSKNIYKYHIGVYSQKYNNRTKKPLYINVFYSFYYNLMKGIVKICTRANPSNKLWPNKIFTIVIIYDYIYNFFQASVPSVLASYGIFMLFLRLEKNYSTDVPQMWDTKLFPAPVCFIAFWCISGKNTTIKK